MACADARNARGGEASRAMPLTPLHPLARRASSAPLSPDRYLTDGRRLFRVVAQFPSGAEQAFASLEDCLTLDVQAYAPGELHQMSLRPVRTVD